MPKCVPQLPDSEWEACTADGLEIAVHSLKQVHRWDAHLLAIESLVQLTEKTSKCRAFCAKNILSKDSELLCTILSLIQCSRMKDSEEFNSNSTNTAKEQHLQVMHRHALVILANCLQILELSGDLAAALNDVPELTCDATLQALVSDMSTAASKPHDAAAACRCLHLLCRCCTDSKQRVLQLGAADHVSAALQCRHAILQKECALLMRDL